ncbi:hypothetical protein A5733_06060 [Mycobacterium sp. NS-7484]|uniref:hypothetical protein n=1 Tax=Mycobacterium sp. NS-7484 TaxID=1834161 RepID=UPI00096E95E6|nr:hypothetical protein [Mycobacterium sp. NS-7484]OMB99431.1 hypothetical protein A5733_06060 [Mycobacterium sp. NS-7484]
MKLTKFVAAVLTLGALGAGAPVAAATPTMPTVPAPLKPGHGHDDCFPFCDGGPPGRDFDHRRDHWDDKGPWWANNRHDWWDDRNGPPPWGWGPPPPLHWRGGPLPRTVNYWGYNLNPVWDNGFRQWGVWLFGVWIPIIGVGVN